MSKQEYDTRSVPKDVSLTFTRVRLAIKYHICQDDTNGLQRAVTEHYKGKLPSRLVRLHRTVLTAESHAARIDFNEKVRPLGMRHCRMLALDMTTRILLNVFHLDPGWLLALQQGGPHCQLESDVLRKSDLEEDFICNALETLVGSPPYQFLHRRDPTGFPLMGTSKNPWRRLANFFKAFLQRGRAIPVESKALRRTDPERKSRKLYLPFYRFKYDKLVERLQGYRNPDDAAQVIDVTSLGWTMHEGMLLINGTLQVPWQEELQQAILVEELPSRSCHFLVKQVQWAWFLKGRVALLTLNRAYGRDLAAFRTELVQLGFQLCDGPVTHLTTPTPRLEVNWISNNIVDASIYEEPLVAGDWPVVRGYEFGQRFEL